MIASLEHRAKKKKECVVPLIALIANPPRDRNPSESQIKLEADMGLRIHKDKPDLTVDEGGCAERKRNGESHAVDLESKCKLKHCRIDHEKNRESAGERASERRRRMGVSERRE